MTTSFLRPLCAVIICGTLIVAGCKVRHEENGGDAKVSIEGPGASVKVDTGTSANDSGIPIYPGAQEKQNTRENKNHAHVNVNTPFLKVKVVALKFTSDDSPEKIVTFYRDKLGNYGSVLECRGEPGDVQVGNNHGGFDRPVSCGKEHDNAGEISLKVGTEGNQHVVAVKPSGKGSEFSLVYVHLGSSKSDEDYAGKQPS
jgi:hypothetical protein